MYLITFTNLLSPFPPSLSLSLSLKSPVIGSLESLSEFWIDLNLLISLPDEICLLKRLTFLELSENRLMNLPESFGNLTLLCDLYLPENLLNELPDSFGKPTTLFNQ